ncbi:cytochrome c-type biogenesis protein CcmE [Thiogranum longum]|uniref:Cytochrome c-type biogenesis protein CcmE n=1 Tax=Thiogranum longum TaxID=1537524 RepID=A0A4R1H9M9_9GAMM|nr:cytochrome c-type biogenesis protein CcmE [Thiogranum longum]
MNPARRKRLILIGLMVAGVAIAVGFALNAFNQNLMFFYSPSEVASGEAPADHTFRLGGLVTNGSVKRLPNGLTTRFDVTDNTRTVTIEYTGILPDLFREGQGIVAHGKLNTDGVFIADEVLAKHDENYMPPEVADALKKSHEVNSAAGGREDALGREVNSAAGGREDALGREVNSAAGGREDALGREVNSATKQGATP